MSHFVSPSTVVVATHHARPAAKTQTVDYLRPLWIPFRLFQSAGNFRAVIAQRHFNRRDASSHPHHQWLFQQVHSASSIEATYPLRENARTRYFPGRTFSARSVRLSDPSTGRVPYVALACRGIRHCFQCHVCIQQPHISRSCISAVVIDRRRWKIRSHVHRHRRILHHAHRAPSRRSALHRKIRNSRRSRLSPPNASNSTV